MRHADPLIVLQARIEVRARLWKDGEYSDLNEMMQPLYQYAERHGLIEIISPEEIDGLMLRALEGKL